MEFDYEEYLDEYFDPMGLTDEEKEDRKEIAKEIREAVLFWFWLLLLAFQYAVVDLDNLKGQLRSRLAQVVYNHSTADAYTVQYLDTLTNSIFDATMKDVNKQTQDAYLESGYDLERTYALSDERATFIGANEANSLCNRESVLQAMKEGKTHKTWHTMIDKRTRRDHEIKDENRIKIDKYFKFLDCKMFFPHDEVNGTARQVINCRCSISFDSDGVTTRREEKYDEYSSGWESASLKETVNKFASIGEIEYNKDTKKTIYVGKKYNVIYDNNNDYFRVEDKRLYGSRRYTSVDGEDVSNEYKDGRYSGRSKADYRRITHFKNSDYE